MHCVHIWTDLPIAASYKFLWIVISCVVCAVELQLSILWGKSVCESTTRMRVWMWLYTEKNECRSSFISSNIHLQSPALWATVHFVARFMRFSVVFVRFFLLIPHFPIFFVASSLDFTPARVFLSPTFNHLTILLLYQLYPNISSIIFRLCPFSSISFRLQPHVHILFSRCA